MTHALEEMLMGSINPEDNEQVHELAGEVLQTSAEIQAGGDRVSERERAELTKAALVLAESGNIDALTSLASAAVVTGDPDLMKKTTNVLNEKFPTDTLHAVSNFANGRLRGDFLRAMHLMETLDVTMPQALGMAGDIGDAVSGQHLASSTVDDALGHAHKEAIARDLAIEEARVEARKALKVSDPIYEDFDDAVPYDPFADEDTEYRHVA